MSVIGDGAGGALGGKLGARGKKIGIKKNNGKNGNREVPVCRRRRAGGSPGCSKRPEGPGDETNPSKKHKPNPEVEKVWHFDEIEKFKPVSGLRVTAIDDGGPIKRVQQNPNYRNRVEFVDAYIEKKHLEIKHRKPRKKKGDGKGEGKGKEKESGNDDGPTDGDGNPIPLGPG